MSLNATPSSERVRIAFFGRRNAGKSSLVNAVAGQDVAVVSDVKGTTTDPVPRAMELLPLGPVVLVDTPGFDDEGDLGAMRVGRAMREMNRADVAVLVIDASAGGNAGAFSPTEKTLAELFGEKGIPYIVALNKTDLLPDSPPKKKPPPPSSAVPFIETSAKTGMNIEALKVGIAAAAASAENGRRLVGDLLKPHDAVLLVVPIDKAAPKGRLILPQQQVIRDALEAGALAVVARDGEIAPALAALGGKPALVVTDSQVFAPVARAVPEDVPLTSFSILFARYKGGLDTAVRGFAAIGALADGDRVLICEGCTHHRQCDDIGTVKLPRMIREFSGKEPEFVFCSGGDFPEDPSPFAAVVHCGGCMVNDREMRHRRLLAEERGVPFTNYGVVMAGIRGILDRCTAMLREPLIK